VEALLTLAAAPSAIAEGTFDNPRRAISTRQKA